MKRPLVKQLKAFLFDQILFKSMLKRTESIIFPKIIGNAFEGYFNFFDWYFMLWWGKGTRNHA